MNEKKADGCVVHRLRMAVCRMIPRRQNNLHIEDAARGLGFERTESKNGVEYTSIRWERVEGF